MTCIREAALLKKTDINELYVLLLVKSEATLLFLIHFCLVIKTRMTTFIKTKLKISDDQTNIDKYRLAANITD